MQDFVVLDKRSRISNGLQERGHANGEIVETSRLAAEQVGGRLPSKEFLFWPPPSIEP